MVNFNELEKFIVSGKTMTLVILVDGKEIGALSFKIDTLAYKEILETKSPQEIKIPDKQPEVKPVAKPVEKAEKPKQEKLKKAPVPTAKPVEEKIEPEPMDDDDDELPWTGDEAENEKPIEKPVVSQVKLTREQVMAQAKTPKTPDEATPVKPSESPAVNTAHAAEVQANEHSSSKSAEQIDKGPDLFGEEW